MDGRTSPPCGKEFNLSDEGEAGKLLQELISLNVSPELLASTSQLITVFQRHPEDMPHLIVHLKTLIQEFTPKCDPGGIQEFTPQSDPGHERQNTAQSDEQSSGLFSGRSKRKREVKVHLIITSETYGADEHIIDQLKRDLVLITTDPAQCEAVLLFCVVITRAGSDVEEAFRTIPDAAVGKPVFLVLMFHTRNENLLTDGDQWQTKYKEIECHVDILFHQSKNGLLKCKQNKQAMQKLMSICASK